MNLGNVLGDLGRADEAEPALVQSVELNSAIAAANPRDVQVRLDLSRCDNNLGELLRSKGGIQQALTSFTNARSVGEKLVHEFPAKPRYREERAGTLTNVAVALESIDPAKAEATHPMSLTLYEKLVAERPDNIDYRIGQARCLYNLSKTGPRQRARSSAQGRRAWSKRGRLSRAARQPPARTGLDRPHAMFLREAIDTNPKLAAPIKADTDIKRIVSQPEFREIIQALVDLGR
jgi:tetratricopeptide (TPR) repeat protein